MPAAASQSGRHVSCRVYLGDDVCDLHAVKVILVVPISVAPVYH